MTDHIKLIWHAVCICCLEFVGNHKLNPAPQLDIE